MRRSARFHDVALAASMLLGMALAVDAAAAAPEIVFC